MPDYPPSSPPEPSESSRADIWLWAVRLFKTRGLAAEACKGGKVHRLGAALKPAANLRPGDLLTVQTEAVKRSIRVEKIIARRVGAPIAATCYADLTDPAILEAAREARRLAQATRPAGDGRPTKLDRRQMEKLRDALRGMGYGTSDD